MGKTIVAFNAGPRKGWNTDTILSEAAVGRRFCPESGGEA